MPQLGDPHFHRSVVLMIEHNPEGAMGLVVNREAPVKLADLSKGESFKVAEHRAQSPVYLGGPVEPYRGFLLHDSEQVNERLPLCPGLFLSVTQDALEPLLLSSEARVRFCLGYAGWGPKQIERELAQGAWLFADANASAVLDGDPASLWSDTLKSMGVDPAMIVSGGGIH